MKKLICTAAVCLGLSGCLLPGDYARIREAAVQDQTCRSWGLKPGTDAYANCRVELSREQLARDVAADQAIADWQRTNAQMIRSMGQMHTCTYNGVNTGGGISGGTSGGTMNCM